MTSPYSELGPELRLLAQAILERLDPAVQAAAAMAGDALRGPGSCQQVWCPVCAVMALMNGEQHPLLNLLAEHSVTLMAVLRSMLDDAGATAPPAEPGAPDSQASEGPPPSSNGRYHHIPIVVETPSDPEPSA